ncbi:MAG: hypothetical protein IJV87_04825 [Clostridia bacterium]|nr:hypothetical protein [Clostridia bacterium]
MGNNNKNPKYGQKTKKDKAVAIACIVFVVLIVAVFAVTAMNETGLFIRMTKNVSGETITVDGAMMSFFMNDSIVNFYNNYAAYMMYGLISLDLTKDLSAQTVSATDAYYTGATSGVTWYDYFLSTVKSEVTYYVTLAEAAKNVKDKDLSLTKEDYAEIDGIIKDITASLKENGASYSDWYGKGVTKKDVRKCYELIYLATNFAEYMQEKYELELDEDTDNKIVNKYVEDHKEDFYTAEVLKYVISVAGNKYETDALYDAAVLQAKESASKISGAASIEEFFSLIEEYESELAETETEETTEATTTEGTEETTTEDTTEDVTTEGTTKEETSEPTLEDKIEDNKVVIEYETGSEHGDWLFGSESNSAAEEGDCSYFVETETKEETTKTTKEVEETTEGTTSSSSSSTAKKTYEVTNITIYYVLSPSSINMDATHDFGYLVSSDMESLETFVSRLNEAIKSGDMTKEKFVEIAEALKGELSSDITTFEYNSGEKQAEGVFKDTYKAMNEWLEDDARKDGDVSDILTINVDSKTTNYAVLFFEGHNDATWYVAAYAGVVSEKFDEWYEAELKAKPLTFNTDALEKINTIRFYNN